MVFTFLRYRICGKNVPWRTAGNGYFVLCFRVFAVQELCQKRTMTCCGKRVFRTAFLRFCGTEFAQEADGFVLQRPGCGGPKLVHNGAKSGQSRVPKWAKSGQNRTGSLINFRRARWGPKVVPMWARGWPRSGQFSTGSLGCFFSGKFSKPTGAFQGLRSEPRGRTMKIYNKIGGHVEL